MTDLRALGSSRVFCRYDLRTTDADAARAFYAEVVELDFTSASSPLAVWPLHEQARARGAPPHWLGQIGVEDVEATAARFVAEGGTRLGPTVRGQDGTAWTNVRDPSGAVLAVRGTIARAEATPVAWHQHHSVDVERAWALYAELFGWARTETVDVPDPVGGHWHFAWERGGKTVGSMANTARTPGIHAQWLFYFAVKDVERVIEGVHARGGRALTKPIALPNGDRVVPCVDPQGGAFGMYEAR